MFHMILEQLINGLVLGSMYALIASGLSLIWGSMKVLNFAHGEFFMLGGYIAFFFIVVLNIPSAPAGFLTIIVLGMIGLVVGKLSIVTLINKPNRDMRFFIATLGLSIFLQNFALHIWGERFKNIPYFTEEVIEILSFKIAEQRLIILGAGLITVLVGALFLKFTRYGLAFRATAHDLEAAALLGINTQQIYTGAMGISAGLAGLAAFLLAPIFSVNPWMGATIMLKALCVCVLGGMGSLPGSILGGIILGISESVTILLWSTEWKDVTALVLLLIILWLRPSGLLGHKEN